MLALQILIDGFAISALYGLGAVGFTLIFESLRRAEPGPRRHHGRGSRYRLGGGRAMYAVGSWIAAAAGTAAGLVTALVTYAMVVRPIQKSRAVPIAEKEIFVLTGTLLWGIMIQELIAYLYTDNPKTVPPLIPGIVDIGGVRTPTNELLIAAICWATLGALWLLVTRSKIGKVLLAASINPRGLTLLGFELSRVYLLVWAIYGLLAGIAGVLLATFLGASSTQAGQLTASAFSIVVLGGLGSVPGSLIAAYVVGYLETVTAYLVSPTIRSMPALILLVLVVYARPQGLLGRR